MRCPNCDGDQINEDESTGQLICSECGVGTGVYHGITQSQDYSETRGLRVVGKIEEPSRPVNSLPIETIDLNTVAGLDPGVSSTPAVGYEGISTTEAVSRKGRKSRSKKSSQPDPTKSFYLSDASDEDMDRSVFQTDQTGPPKEYHRPWRLSEPFTLIMRRQAEELATILQLSVERRERFLNTVWQLWLNYLSVTGELGEAAWTHASAGPIRATRILMDLCDAKWIYQRSPVGLLSYLTGSIPHGGRLDREANATEHRLRHFMWAGWSTLYEPNEGRENKDPFLKPLLKARHTAVNKYRRLNSGGNKPRKRQKSADATNDTERSANSTCRGSKRHPSNGNDQNTSDGEHNSDSELPQFKAMSDKELIDLLQVRGDSAPVVSTKRERSKTNGEVRKRGRPSYALNRRAVYRQYIIQKLLLPDPWRRAFWRGQLHGRVRCLLSHNLAILFFAYITVSPIHSSVINPIAWPFKDESLLSTGQVALSSLITLSDLHELCRERRLTFINARECLPPGLFAVHDQYLLPLLQPKRPPTLGLLTRATSQMLHFLGCFQLPRLPLGWLIKRQIIALGLPEAIADVCRLLLKRLRVILSHMVDIPSGPLLVCSIPWSRVIRVDVTAMAMVVIALRLLFKFDGLSEYRLSCIAKALRTGLSNTVDSNGDESKYPFDWTTWATYVEDRFRQSSLAINDQRTYLNVPGPEAPLRSNNIRGSDLTKIDSTKEFLGPYEFQLGQSIGWGETVMYARKHGQTETKSALTKPLRELLAEKEQETSQSPNAANCPSSPQPSATNHAPELCLTEVHRQGSCSPFRPASLDFLLKPSSTRSLDLLNNPFLVSLSIPERRALSDWWMAFSARRSLYVPIGSWISDSNDSSIPSKFKRFRTTDEPCLPPAVKRLILTHNRQLAELLQLSRFGKQPETSREMDKPNDLTSSPHASSSSDESVTNLHGVDALPVQRPTEVGPSESVQWLVQICSIACNSSSIGHLLVEIEMLERLLFPEKKETKNMRQADLALITCLDLR